MQNFLKIRSVRVGGLVGVFGLAMLAAQAGCGSDDTKEGGVSATPDGAAGAAGSAGTGGSAGSSGGFAVMVSTLGSDSKPTPLEGALVALDVAGTRKQATTDGSGRALFADLDATAGPVDITAHKSGYAAVSVLGVDASAADAGPAMTLSLRSLGAEDLVTVSGAATGMASTSNFLYVSTTPGRDAHQGMGPNFSLDVPRGKPFRLVAVELAPGAEPSPHGLSQNFFGWSVNDHPALTANTTVNPDFSVKATPEKVSGSFNMPDRVDSPLRGPFSWGYFYVTSSSLTDFLGAPTRIDLSADGSSFTFESEFVRAVPDAEAFTYYQLHGTQALFPTDPIPDRSLVLVPGYPQSGSRTFDFPDVAKITSSQETSPHATITWEYPGNDAPNVFWIGRSIGPVWTVSFREGRKELTVPELPTGSSETELFLDGAEHWGMLARCERDESVPEAFKSCARRAITQSIVIKP